MQRFQYDQINSLFLLLSLLLPEDAFERFGQFQCVRGNHKFGLSVKVLRLFFNLIGWFSSLHNIKFIKITMQRQYVHLPNLNSLYLQHQLYQKHRQHLNKSKSTIQTHNQIGIQSKEVHQRYRQVLALKEKDRYIKEIEGSPANVLKESILMKYRSVSPTERQESRITPFEKRKLSQRNQENHRIYEALQFSVPIVSTGSPKAHSTHQALKARISKFTRKGTLVVYKFKKSLAQITRRRQQQKARENSYTDPIVEAKKKLQNFIDYRSKVNLEGTSSSTDIYLNLQETNIRNARKQGQKAQTTENLQPSDKQSEDRPLVEDKYLRKHKDKYSKSERCKTDPCESTFTTPCKQLRQKKIFGSPCLATRVQQHGRKLITNIYLLPKSQLLVKKKSRQQLGDMEIVCLPQVKNRRLEDVQAQKM